MIRVSTIPGYLFVGNDSRSSKPKVLGKRQFGLFSGAPFCLHEYMSRRRFESTLEALKVHKKRMLSFQAPF
jgi:hypothetical protein